MTNTNHYVLTTSDDTIEIHTRDVSQQEARQMIIVAAMYKGLTPGEINNTVDCDRPFQKMNTETVAAVVENQGLCDVVAKEWLTEEWSHVLENLNKSVSEAVPYDVPRNIGVREANTEMSDGNIKAIKFLNPKDSTVKEKFLRYIFKNKPTFGLMVLSIIIDGYRITMAIIEDGYQIGERTICVAGRVALSHALSTIGSALGSLIPGIGSFVGGILGAIIYSLIDGKVKTLLCGLFPKIAVGPGAPDPDYDSFFYGDNQNFDIPVMDYTLPPQVHPSANLSSTYEFPPHDYKLPSRFGPPRSDYELPKIFRSTPTKKEISSRDVDKKTGTRKH